MKKPPENWPKNWRKKKHWNVRWLQFETSNLQEECRLDICRIFVKFSNVISILPYLLRSRMLPPDLSKRFRVKKMNTRLQWNQCCALQWSKNFIKSWCLFFYGITHSSPMNYRSMDLNQPMSEEEARLWQELCDAVMRYLINYLTRSQIHSMINLL